MQDMSAEVPLSLRLRNAYVVLSEEGKNSELNSSEFLTQRTDELVYSLCINSSSVEEGQDALDCQAAHVFDC